MKPIRSKFAHIAQILDVLGATLEKNPAPLGVLAR
jgi:hypothetical protein